MKIGLIVGSLREDSYNMQIAKAVEEMLDGDVKAEIIDIKNIPLYNADLEGDKLHPEFKRIREEVRNYDAFIFFTPEYNRSFAPASKNVIDIVSVDPNGNGWSGKPATVFSASIGGMGGLAGNLALRQVFVNVNLIPMQKPEIYLANVGDCFDEKGKLVEKTYDYIKKAADAFVDFAKKFA